MVTSLPVTFSSPFWLLLMMSLLLLMLMLRAFLQWKFRRHSNPATYPLIGCLLSFYRNRHHLLHWYTDMLSLSPSQTIIISRFGARRTIVTANPQNVEYVLKSNFSNFPKGKPFTEILRDFLGNGIFNVDGDLWYDQRKLAIHQFNARSSLRNYVERVLKEEVEKKLLPVLESAAEDKAMVDLQDLLRRLAFDMVCRFALSYDPGCLELEYKSLGTKHPIVDAFDAASDICARRGAAPLSAMWKVKRFFNLGSEKRLGEAMNRIHQFVNQVIQLRKGSIELTDESHSHRERDLLSKMVLGGRGEAVMRDIIISIIMAGRDTTSSAMTWLFHLLAHHPEAENKVMRELRRIWGDENSVELETLKGMTWLKSCICESMRLFPPIAWDSKHAVADDMLPDGTPVRAGDRVTYFPYGMGRMERLWGEDRLRFKPERWASERGVGPYKFPVFQAGPRVCLGKELAFIQMKYVVGSIMRRFCIRPANQNHQPVFVPLLTAHMAGGFKVFVSRRN
ncbi:cytochrome P450 94B3-like [Andrographis paniculata]|uniref:cytochrome P450 94B3-like n=1 Tax=Andrographis paniculata TaxID=175694 RepID=UPI0021E76888|nr:cytochrome P450 94B3-like [Andrographis paniculata]